MQSRRGQLLIASPRLRDPNFFKTVVLIVKDDEEGGTLGVILNRPMAVSVADAVSSQVDAASSVEEPIHQGGPCEGPLVALHTNPAAAGDEVIEGVRFSMERDAIEWLMENNQGPIKYFAGYSGWGKGQLDAELEEGAWQLTAASHDHVFDARTGDWSKLITWLAMGRKVDIGRIPDDPSVN
jgi:putative transcriptional regulator